MDEPLRAKSDSLNTLRIQYVPNGQNGDQIRSKTSELGF